jgi:hypothetical protein
MATNLRSVSIVIIIYHRSKNTYDNGVKTRINQEPIDVWALA